MSRDHPKNKKMIKKKLQQLKIMRIKIEQQIEKVFQG